MRRPLLGLAVVLLGLSVGGSTGFAQFGANTGNGVFNDPFSLYYGLYLPRQAQLASQTTSQDVIGSASVARQEATARSEERSIFEVDTEPFGIDDLDPTNPGVRKRSGGGRSYLNRRPASFTQGKGVSAPAQYYGRGAGLARYYPNIKVGHQANANVPSRGVNTGARGRSGGVGSALGGMGMGGMSGMGGMGGMR